MREPRHHNQTRKAGPASLLTITAVSVVILTIGTIVLRDWGALLFAPAFWNPPKLIVPDIPSIAIRPFTTANGEPANIPYGKGLAGDISQRLSLISTIFVIDHKSAKELDPTKIAADGAAKALGVQYVLDGEIYQGERGIHGRVNLFDRKLQENAWSRRYNYDAQQIFSLRDELLLRILETLGVKTTQPERSALTHRHTPLVGAYTTYLQGAQHIEKETEDTHTLARAFLSAAIDLDPAYAPAHAGLARSYLDENHGDKNHVNVERNLRKALSIDDALPEAHLLKARLALSRHQHQRGVTAVERALVLRPNYAAGYAFLANLTGLMGRPKEALSNIEKAMRLHPRFPPSFLTLLGHLYRMLGRNGDGILLLRRAQGQDPQSTRCYLQLAAAYTTAGLPDQAQKQIQRLLEVVPSYTTQRIRQEVPYSNAETMAKFVLIMKEAGLP